MNAAYSSLNCLIFALIFQGSTIAQEISNGNSIVDAKRIMEAQKFQPSKAELRLKDGESMDQWHINPGILIVSYETKTKRITEITYSNEFGGRKGLRHNGINFVVKSFDPTHRKLIVKLDTKLNNRGDISLTKVFVNHASDVLSLQMQAVGYGEGIELLDDEQFGYRLWTVEHGIFTQKWDRKTTKIVAMTYVQIVTGEDGHSASAINVESVDFLNKNMTLLLR